MQICTKYTTSYDPDIQETAGENGAALPCRNYLPTILGDTTSNEPMSPAMLTHRVVFGVVYRRPTKYVSFDLIYAQEGNNVASSHYWI